MVCLVADNPPLKRLSVDLGEQPRCHSRRDKCIQGFSAPDDDAVLGAPGAAIGYCQALFNYAGNPNKHSELVAKLLLEAGAPWARSHELFWSFRRTEEPDDFVTSAMRPLCRDGRVPVVITKLDPAADCDEIRGILRTKVPLAKGETILLRLVLGSEASLKPAAELIRDLVSQAREQHAMPQWWPLFQSTYPVEVWTRLAAAIGPAWKYVNLAVNPFTDTAVLDHFREQITVAQLPIGLAEGIGDDGSVKLTARMSVSGASGEAKWSLSGFFNNLAERSLAPTLIILGPALPEWTDAVNVARIARFVPALREACPILWRGMSVQRRELLFNLTA